MHIRSKDTVVVITGKDKGKQGKVLTAFPKTGKVVVEGVAIATKQAAIDASNVMLVCPKCKKGVRVGHKILDNGTKVRVCVKCGTAIDE